MSSNPYATPKAAVADAPVPQGEFVPGGKGVPAARTLHPGSIGAITIDMSTSFIGGGTGAKLLADARVLKDGRSMSFVEAEARNADGSLVAKAIATVRVRQREKT